MRYCLRLVLEPAFLPVQADIVPRLLHPERLVLDLVAIQGLFPILALVLCHAHGLFRMRRDPQGVSSLRPKVKARAVVDEPVVPDGHVVDFPLDPGGVFGSLGELRVEKGEGVVALGFRDAEDTTGKSRVDKDTLDTGDRLETCLIINTGCSGLGG